MVRTIFDTLIALTIVSLAISLIFFNEANDVSQLRNSYVAAQFETSMIPGSARWRIYQQVREEAMEFAPPDKTLYQLRGSAQTRAQLIINRLTKKYRLPRFQLSGIRFRDVLATPTVAGSTNHCLKPERIIFLNEIMFLRNYENFMSNIIPHEVAHLVVCLRGGFEGQNLPHTDAHGPEWEEVMRDLGFFRPLQTQRTHDLDTMPVIDYTSRVAKEIIRIDRLAGIESTE